MGLSIHLANAAGYATLIEDLMNEGGSVFDLVENSGMHMSTVRKLMRVLYRRKPKKLVHICGWDQDSTGRWVIAIYKFGNETDAKRPVKMTPSERTARHRAKKREARMRLNSQPRQPKDNDDHDLTQHTGPAAGALEKPAQRVSPWLFL